MQSAHPAAHFALGRSHVWSTGQDQCAVIKRQLQLLLPGVVIFLDVDDVLDAWGSNPRRAEVAPDLPLTHSGSASGQLEDIGDLESYVRATGVMLFFLSKHYFSSRNCIREIRASFDEKRPLVLVHEQQLGKGGGPLEMLKAECRDEMRGKIFDGRTPIVWHRVSHYQNLTLKLIATEMLRNGASAQQRHSSASDKPPLNLVLPGEVCVSKLALPQPLVLWCSAANPGAAAVAQELVQSLAPSGGEIRVVDSKPDVTALEADGQAVAMLLYLNENTWVEQGPALERDVRATHSFSHGLVASLVRMGSNLTHGHRPQEVVTGRAHDGPKPIKIILVHENDAARGGCEFGQFFGTTPPGLVEEGIYHDIAIALHCLPHRTVSLALAAQALGAINSSAAAAQQRRRGSHQDGLGRGARRSLAQGSSSSQGQRPSQGSEVAVVEGTSAQSSV